jgi:hypothetical protein
MNKVYLVYVHSCEGNPEYEAFDATVWTTLEAAKKHLSRVVKDFREEILPTYNDGEYSISESSTYFWFNTDCEDDNYYHVYIKDCEVNKDECSN